MAEIYFIEAIFKQQEGLKLYIDNLTTNQLLRKYCISFPHMQCIAMVRMVMID